VPLVVEHLPNKPWGPVFKPSTIQKTTKTQLIKIGILVCLIHTRMATIKNKTKGSVVVHNCNLSAWEAEAKFQASLVYIVRPCTKK
jgi:hypothetical protein